jgi:type II secretory pathway pseudopilin PulG
MKRFAQKGYSVVEVLLAGALFAIVAGGVVTAIIYAQRTNESAFAREKAVRLAEEGVQAVRSIRQRDFDLLVNASSIGLTFEENVWKLVYYPTENDDITTDGFRRRIRIEDGPTTFSKAVSIRVDYITGGVEREVELSTIVSDLEESDDDVTRVDGQDRLVSNNYIIQNDSQSPGQLQDLVIQSVKTVGGVEFWFAADQNISLSEGSAVSLWYDISGNDHHLVQLEPEVRPTWEDGVINGYPALRFDGENDLMNFPTVDLEGNDGMTAFVVSSASSDRDPNDDEGAYGAFYFQGGWGGKLYVSPQQNAVSYKFGAPPEQGGVVYTRPSSIGTDFTLTGVVKDQGTENLYIDGVNVNTETGRSFPTAEIPGPGYFAAESEFGFSHFHGYIAEVIVFNKALSPTEYATIEGYLNDKYNIY